MPACVARRSQRRARGCGALTGAHCALCHPSHAGADLHATSGNVVWCGAAGAVSGPTGFPAHPPQPPREASILCVETRRKCRPELHMHPAPCVRRGAWLGVCVHSAPGAHLRAAHCGGTSHTRARLSPALPSHLRNLEVQRELQGLVRLSTASLCLGPWLCVMMVFWLLLIQHLQYSHQCLPWLTQNCVCAPPHPRARPSVNSSGVSWGWEAAVGSGSVETLRKPRWLVLP